MPRKIIFLPGALQESQNAYTWYEEKESGLGKEFYRSLSTVLSLIARDPEI